MGKILSSAYDYAVKEAEKIMDPDTKAKYGDAFKSISQPGIDKIMVMESGQGFDLTRKGLKVANTFGKALQKELPKEFFVKFLGNRIIDINRKEGNFYLIKYEEVKSI